MATSVVTLLRSLQGIEVGPNEAPLLVIDDEGNWIGFTKEQTPEKTATAAGEFTLIDPVVDGETVTIGTDVGGADGTPATKGLTLHDSSYLYIAVDDTEDSTGWKKISLSSL